MSVQNQIQTLVTEALSPTHLEVINESHMHRTPKDAETHFKVIVVSDEFEGKRLLARHRIINGLLQSQFDAGLHALALHTYTEAEWSEQQAAPKTPGCTGSLS
ncbi:BolA family protein [Ferrimonas aestuarii]|uniref:DNA-binding transcriptional regulator BolA n=1 Tax=Ferrimonas aestuarii TaxID=2569539 RepID=A0A4U1BEX3_9GAMM|nr:BolA family protein [Ferrimonas aestuarii]TKB49625.1 BolA family transcriptional regulator [Ferrimonas aestuarii]